MARPQNLHAFEDCEDVAKLAAVYAHGLAKNHPFVDGNKRAAFVTAELFLLLNGYELTATDADCVLTMVGVADGSVSEDELANWIRDHIEKISE